MRTIKFRGRDYNGVWHVGNLLLTENVENAKASILTSRKMKDDGYEEITYVVAPDTVGQFSGMLDTDAKEIYENDVVEWTDNGVKRDIVGWVLGGMYLLQECKPIGSCYFSNLKVICNIHDNPELLEGKEI